MNTTVEQELLTKGQAIIQTTGVSMEPLLHHRRSSVVLVRPDKQLRKNDVVLFRRGDELVLHRIIRFLPDGRLVIKGDNCYGYDVTVREAVIGLMQGYYPDEKDAYITCGSEQDRRYIRTVWLRRLRVLIKTKIYLLFKKMGLR